MEIGDLVLNADDLALELAWCTSLLERVQILCDHRVHHSPCLVHLVGISFAGVALVVFVRAALAGTRRPDTSFLCTRVLHKP